MQAKIYVQSLLPSCLKGQCHEIFDFWFSSWISFPQAYPEHTIRAVLIFFFNLAEILAAQGAPPVSLTPVANWKKSSIIKVIIILFGHLWEVELTNRYIFAFKFTLRSQQHDIVPIICPRCHWHWRQICHQCHWYRWCILTCKYLCKFFKKMWNGPNGILWGWGETDPWKKPEAKNLVTLSL